MGEHLVAHKAPIHITKLLIGTGARCIGQADAPPNPQTAGGWGGGVGHCSRSAAGPPIDSDGLRQKVFAQYIGQAAVQGLVVCGTRFAAPPLLDQLAFVPDRKAHIRAGQRMAAHGLYAVRKLCSVGLQKLAPGRGAVKQLFDLDRGALAARHGPQFTRAAIQQKGRRLACSPRKYCAISY